MYNSDFICTYKKLLEEDQEDMYRIQFLQAFNLVKWDSIAIGAAMKKLYNSIKDNNDIIEILNKMKDSQDLNIYISLLGDDEEDIFCLLFNFELFYLAHRCFCDIMNEKTIIPINKQSLLENL